MLNKLNLAVLFLYRYKAKHFGIFLLLSVVVFILGSVLFISMSIKKDLLSTLDAQADIIVQRYEGGRVVDTPQKWLWEFLNIKGISKAEGRIYGRHFFEQPEDAFMIVGIDFFDTTLDNDLKNLIEDIDISKFREKNYMIVGNGVRKFFDYYEYYDYYIFRPPDRTKVKVWFYKNFKKESEILSSDTIFLDKKLARKILGIKDGYITDIALEIKNKDELELVRQKLIISHFNSRIITKNDIRKFYTNLYNYKTGVFLVIFFILFFTFLYILYHRYSITYKEESKEISLLRIMGYKISDIITIKLFESFFVAAGGYLAGILGAFFYVYLFNAPLLKDIFLGFKNFSVEPEFGYVLDVEMLIFIFMIIVIPFILVVSYPVFKLSQTDPFEIVK